jgi:hypothetical protein
MLWSVAKLSGTIDSATFLLAVSLQFSKL